MSVLKSQRQSRPATKLAKSIVANVISNLCQSGTSSLPRSNVRLCH